MLYNQNQEATIRVSKRQALTKQVQRTKDNETKEVEKILVQADEIREYKECLLEELGNEQVLNDEIQAICAKYKKLIFEQKRDKEKLSFLLGQQKKIIGNLEARRETVASDTDKIFGQFSQTVEGDGKQRQRVSLQNSVLLSKKDLSVLKC